jgi:arginase
LRAQLVRRLVELVEASGAVLVLSTFWRPFLPYVQYVLTRYGLPAEAVIGRTPGVSGATAYANGSGGEQLFTGDAFDDEQYVSRAAEIHAWLAAHPAVTRYVVLDDRPSAADAALAARFVQTDAAHGLTAADAARCRALLAEECGACEPARPAPVHLLRFPQWQGSAERRHAEGAAAAAAAVAARLRPAVESDVAVAAPRDGAPPARARGDVLHLDAIATQAAQARRLLEEAAAAAGGAARGLRVFVAGGDCGVEVAPVAHANAAHPGLALVWFDAHADLNDATSSPSGHFHGMPVRTLLGDAPPGVGGALASQLKPSQLIYVGVRDIDPPERAYIDGHAMVLLPPAPAPLLARQLEAALRGFDAAYVHVDLDVLDPAVFPCTCCPTAGGLSLDALLDAIAAVRRAVPLVAGCGLTECCGDPTAHGAQLAAVVDALASALE